MTKARGPHLIWFSDLGRPWAAMYPDLYYGNDGKRPENVLAEHALSAEEAEMPLDRLIERYPAPQQKGA